jgi:hypothetical protein
MSDDVIVSAGSGDGATFRATDVAGKLRPHYKVAYGGTGVATDVDVGTPLPVISQGGHYETVAASQTDQALGATGATGDCLAGLTIIPANLNPGAVQVKDGSGSAVTIFTGGTGSVSSLVPFFVYLGNSRSTGGAWKVTTGASVSVWASGRFT